MARPIIEIDKLPLDNTIKYEENYYAADNGMVRSEFYETGNRVIFERNGRRFTWTPQEMKYVDSWGMEDVIYMVQDVPLETKANYARYNRSMPDIDDWFIMENNQLKHQILVQGFQRDPLPFLTDPVDFAIGGQIEFDSDLRIFADGVEQTDTFETKSSIYFMDNTGEVVFNLPPVVAYDSKIPERAMAGGKYRVHTNSDGVLAFLFVLDNAWISSVERVYPIVIDPTVIVNSAYSSEGNGGRKLTQLSNGWLIALVFDGSYRHYLYKSEDQGATWTLLASQTNDGRYSKPGSLVAFGTRLSVALPFNSTSPDPNQDNVVVFTKDVLSGWTFTGGVYIGASEETESTSLAVDSAGVIHLAWNAKTSTYPNSFNIRYSRSTDGGTTWASPTQVTTKNTTGDDYRNPSIVILLNGYPVIFDDQKQGSFYYITSQRWDGFSWIIDGASPQGGTSNLQSSPSSVVDSNGVIHVVWHGADSTDSSVNNLRYSKSTDGGATWTAVTKLTSGNTYNQQAPSIIVDKNNKIRVLFQGRGSGSYDQIRLIENDGNGWGAITDKTSNTINHARYPSSITKDDLIAWIYQDLQSSSVQFDKIVLNFAPNAPTLGTKDNFDATAAVTFNWTFSDPDSGNTQSAYQLQIIRVSDGVTVVDTGKVASTVSTHSLAANTLENNAQYQWKVKTWDNSDAEGPYSSLATFHTSAKPTVTVTAPSSDGTILTSASLTAEWSFSDPESEGQSAYQIKLMDSTDTVLWDSGKVTDVAARSRTMGYTLLNAINYKVKVTVWDAKDIPSVEAVRTFETSFTSPATPTLTATTNNGYIGISITNPTPSGTEPTVGSNDIYRREQGETNWTRIAKGLPDNGSYSDYAAASGVSYEYKVRAIGSNGGTSDSVSVNSLIKLSGIWLHDISDAEATIHQYKYDGQGRNINWETDVTMMQFAGRARPIAEFGNSSDGQIQASLQMIKTDIDHIKLESLIKSRGTVCYRDGRGRKLFGVVSALPIRDEHWGYTTTITIIETDYQEEV